jgi:hypothetical protein
VEAKNILLAHREALEVVAKALVERESLNKHEFLALIGRDVPENVAGGDGRVDAGPGVVEPIPPLLPNPPENPPSVVG